MLRKILLFTLSIGLFSGSLSAEKPNLIFILADDLGYGDLGCFGQEKIKTPRLDALAAKGMKFTQFYAGSTVCAPSRCVLMTGQDTDPMATIFSVFATTLAERGWPSMADNSPINSP